MSWLEALVYTYDDNVKLAGNYDVLAKRKAILPPIGHMMQNAHIEITLDGEGNLLYASVVPKEESQTLIPCTPDSASRTSKDEPHPLHDYLKYVASDYEQYASGKSKKGKTPFEMYRDNLSKWVTSSYCHPKIKTIYQYISTHSMIHDLIEQKILFVDEAGHITNKWPSKEEKPPIFTVLTGDVLKAFVRFRVDFDDGTPVDIWKDQQVQQSYISFFESLITDKKQLCYATGTIQPVTEKHNKAIRFPGDGAKLISSNDTSNFTFRGRFESSRECVQIGYETSQKAMNALKWLIMNQGYNDNGRIFLVWGKREVPDVFANTEKLTRRRRRGAVPADIPQTQRQWADAVNAVLAGYSKELSGIPQVNIIVLDAATQGRLSICYYQEMEHDTFIQRIGRWHKAGMWRQHFYDQENKRTQTYYGVPIPKQIITAAYGENVGDKQEKMEMERIFYSIVQGRAVPHDMMNSVMDRTIKRAVLAVGDTYYKWQQQLLEPACSLIRNRLVYQLQKIEAEEAFTVALDKNYTDRSYLYGRMLAVADRIERSTFKKINERSTNAFKYMNIFAERPFKTWQNIQMKLIPYEQKNPYSWEYVKLLEEIASKFSVDDFALDKPLDGKFLLGFYCQSYDIEKTIQERAKLKQEKNLETDNAK